MEARIHPNPAFRSTDDARNLAFAAQRGFGILSINGVPTPLFAHVPFRLADDGASVELHLVRSNRIANDCPTQQPATLIVSGPDSYISPDWYGIDEQVPTWNYVAVHMHGTLERRPQDELRGVIEGLSEQFEQRLAPKPVWKTDKVPAEVLDRMMRMITPFRLTIESTEATWKLAQNKPDGARQSAADMVRMHGIGQETKALAELMVLLAKS